MKNQTKACDSRAIKLSVVETCLSTLLALDRRGVESMLWRGTDCGCRVAGSGYMRKTEVYHCGLCDIYIKITAKVNAVLVKHCMGKKHFENYKKKLAKMAEKEEEERAAKAKAEAEAAEQEAAKVRESCD